MLPRSAGKEIVSLKMECPGPSKLHSCCNTYTTSDSRIVKLKSLILKLSVCILLRVLDQVEQFPSNETLFQKLFTILSATCFGRTTIFKWMVVRTKHKNKLHGLSPQATIQTE
jgi:hypothetical protein